MSKRALITGITGQDGSYLAELLLAKGYEVHGLVRRVAAEDPDQRYSRIVHILPRIQIQAGSLECQPSVFNVVEKVRPDECYHLAAQSSVGYGAQDEFQTWNVNVSGTHYLLAALRQLAPRCKMFFAASSEIFGAGDGSPRTETSPFQPRSLYGISKLAGFELARHYREKHGLFAATGILFNHESPRRGMEFVTRKITRAVAAILAGRAETIDLWNVSAARDWGAAPDFVEGMWLMLQAEEPEDYVLATGTARTVAQFAEAAFSSAGLDWTRFVASGAAASATGSGEPAMTGDPSRALQKLNWRSRTSFDNLVRQMVEADLQLSGLDPAQVMARASA
ncbi:MAG: GDP-mannose 4,6-dehydratase [Bryobacteraceae bacterium]|nr:GDP-mannose 4,6-dehydratase [Bryobacteraceae bacterium]